MVRMRAQGGLDRGWGGWQGGCSDGIGLRYLSDINLVENCDKLNMEEQADFEKKDSFDVNSEKEFMRWTPPGQQRAQIL